MSKEYFIHDNHLRPYKVEINDRNIKVYKLKNGKTDEYEPNNFLTFKAEKIFIGKSPINKMTEFSGGYGPEFDGNTILCGLKNGNCIFIGSEIFKFRPDAEIERFVSPVGNNDVPYPFATDKAGNFYLLAECVKIAEIPPFFRDEPYDYYYGNFLIVGDGRGTDLFQDGKEFFIGDEKCNLSYKINPENEYENYRKKQLFLILKSGEKVVLNKKSFVKLIEEYGKKMKFSPIGGVKKL
jgi:hypothetical protein